RFPRRSVTSEQAARAARSSSPSDGEGVRKRDLPKRPRYEPATPSLAERSPARDSSIRCSIEEARDGPAGSGVQAEGEGSRREAAVGIPVQARRSWLGASAGGRLRDAD